MREFRFKTAENSAFQQWVCWPRWEDAYSVWENDFSGCVERVLIYREALTQDQVQQAILLTDDDPTL